MSETPASFYVTGGTLRHDAPCYVERRADAELLAALRAGEFCHVLTARQMGKSSLMVRTATRLREQGYQVAVLDLTAIGQNLSPEQWYDGLLMRAGRQLHLEDELDAFARKHGQLSPVQRWFASLQDVCLQHLPGRLVIFVDEIDTILSLQFSTDEFFAAIRECYNRRASDPQFNRLTFCLLGVASPADLIRNPRLTPFNIGRRLELNDFTPTEANALARGLRPPSPKPAEEGDEAEPQAHHLLERILFWTNGHPYLTQRLCSAVARSLAEGPATALNAAGARQRVDEICDELFLTRRAREHDDNLVFVRERLLRSRVDRSEVLTAYARLLQTTPLRLTGWEHHFYRIYASLRSRRCLRDDPANPVVAVLRLSGIARSDAGCLHVRNPIYATVFNSEWVRGNLPGAELRRQRAAFWLGVLRTTGIAVALLLAFGALTIFALKKSSLASRMAQESHQHNVRLKVGYGVRLMEEGDLLSALLRFLEALRLEQDQPANAEVHRLRIGSVLRQCPRLVQLWFHDSEPYWAEFSRDGKWVVITEENGTVRVWDTVTGKPVSSPPQYAKAASYAAFSPEGQRFVTASQDGTARVWETLTAQPITPPLNHSANVNCAVFSPDGRWVATAGVAGRIRVWDARSGELRLPPFGPTVEVARLSFSPDGAWLLSGAADGTAQVWEARTGQPVGKPMKHAREVSAANFSRDGRRVVTASWDNTGRVWDAATGEPITPPLSHRTWLTDAQFSPDLQTVLTTSFDATARLWDATTGRPVSSPLQHRHSVMAGAFSPSGEHVVTACFGMSAQVWQTATGTLNVSPLKHSGVVSLALFSPEGRRVLSLSTDRTSKLWDMATSEVVSPPLHPHSEIALMAVSPAGRQVATVGKDHSTWIWNLQSNTPAAFPLPATGAVHALQFSPDGRHLLTGDAAGAIQLWEAGTRQLTGFSVAAPGPIAAAGFTGDGRRIWAASRQGWAGLWNRDSGRLAAPLARLGSNVLSVGVSPDGTKAAFITGKRAMQIWSLTNARPLTASIALQGEVNDLSFSPDSQRLVTSCKDSVYTELYAEVWDAVSGRHLSPRLKHKDGVLMSRFSPDGRLIATASEDGTAGLWDATTGALVVPLLEHNYQVQCIAFSPDGRSVATASSDTTARVWDVSTGEPLTPPLTHAGPVRFVAFGHDGQILITRSAQGLFLWNLARDNRPLADLVELAELLNSQQLEPGGILKPLDPRRLRASWHDLRDRYPADFQTPATAVLAWHYREAEQCRTASRWQCLLNHLEVLLDATPDDSRLRQLRAEAESGLQSAPTNR